MPQVSLVAILDADKEGFLRNHRSLTQTAGRAARNVNGKVIMYADKVTDSMQRTIDETERRREKQMAYNKEHGITPKQIVKNVSTDLLEIYEEKDTDRKPRRDSGSSRRQTTKTQQQQSKNAAPRAYIEEEHKVTVAADPVIEYMSSNELDTMTEKVRRDMIAAAKRTDFIEAALLRDELIKLQDIQSKQLTESVNGTEK